MTNLDLVHACSSHVVVNPQTLKGRMTWRWRENGHMLCYVEMTNRSQSHPISQTLTPRFGDGWSQPGGSTSGHPGPASASQGAWKGSRAAEPETCIDMWPEMKPLNMALMWNFTGKTHQIKTKPSSRISESVQPFRHKKMIRWRSFRFFGPFPKQITSAIPCLLGLSWSYRFRTPTSGCLRCVLPEISRVCDGQVRKIKMLSRVQNWVFLCIFHGHRRCNLM